MIKVLEADLETLQERCKDFNHFLCNGYAIYKCTLQELQNCSFMGLNNCLYHFQEYSTPFVLLAFSNN